MYTEALSIADYADSEEICVPTGLLEKLYANRAAAYLNVVPVSRWWPSHSSLFQFQSKTLWIPTPFGLQVNTNWITKTVKWNMESPKYTKLFWVLYICKLCSRKIYTSWRLFTTSCLSHFKSDLICQPWVLESPVVLTRSTDWLAYTFIMLHFQHLTSGKVKKRGSLYWPYFQSLPTLPLKDNTAAYLCWQLSTLTLCAHPVWQSYLVCGHIG